MTFLVGQTIVQIKAGAPNNGRGSDNRGEVKQFRAGGDTYPYVSAQAARRWLRDSVPAAEKRSPVTTSGKTSRQQAYTNGRPDLYFDDDLFGYMVAVKDGTVMRDTVLATGTYVAVVPNQPKMDFGTMSRDFPPGTNPIIHEHEHYTADLAGDLLLDLPRVGTFAVGGKTIKTALPDTVVRELLAGEAETVVLRGIECVQLPIAERRRRAAVLLRTMAEVKGGAKQSAHYGDRTPAIVILAPMKGGTNPFTRVIRPKDRKTHFDVDVLREEMTAWADELDGAVRIGWAPGFLGDHRIHVCKDVRDLIEAGRLVFDHPRIVLRGLAEEIEIGEHDDWFTDPLA
jgi:CRISPR-associated protein Cst2